MAVGVFQRFAKMGGDRLFQARGNGVFESFRLGIDLAPVQPEYAGQEGSSRAVPANYATRLGQALLGQLAAPA